MVSGVLLANSGADKKVTVDEILDQVLRDNFESKIKAEKVYQAHHNVNVSISRLLPGLNFSSVLAICTFAVPEITASSIGFIYPSNWFRWKESAFFLKAEQASYATLLANIVNITESLLYRIFMLQKVKDILGVYCDRTESILAEVDRRLPNISRFKQAIYETRNFLFLLRQDYNLLENELAIIEYELLFNLGLDIKLWKKIEFAPIELPNPEEESPWLTKDFLWETIEKSQEISTISNLKKAAKYSILSRYFDFSLPSADIDSNLGFGYISQIKIGKSRVRQLEIELDRTRARMRLQVEKTVQNFNLSLKKFDNAIITKNNGEELVAHLLNELRENSYFDDNFLDGLAFALRGDVSKIESIFSTLTLIAQKRRLVWGSERYHSILKHALSRKDKKGIGLLKDLENKKIKRRAKNCSKSISQT